MTSSQDIVACDICEQEPLQHFCNGCEIRLCNTCVVTHLGSGSVEGHTIVQYKYRDARNIQPRVCLDHPAMIKTLYCRKCLDQICVACIDEHRGHDLIDLKQFVNSQFMEIEKNSEYLRSKLLPNGTECIDKVKLLLVDANMKYDQERQRILDAGKDLHRKVDERVDVLLGEIDKQEKETLDKLQNMIKNTETKLQDIDNTIDMCEAAKSSLDDVLKFNFDESSLDFEHTVEVTFPYFETPANCTVDVGSLKSVRKGMRILEEPFGKNNQSLEGVEEEEGKQPFTEEFRPQSAKAHVPAAPSEGYDVYQRNAVYVDEEKTKDDGGSGRTNPVKSDKDERAEEGQDSKDRETLSESLSSGENSDTEKEDKEDFFRDAMDGGIEFKAELVLDQQPIAVFLQNCQCFQKELQLVEELDEAVNEYDRLLKKAKEAGCPAQNNDPPSQLNAVSPGARCQALYEVISDVSKRCPKARWMDAVTELIILTTYSQSEPRHAQHQRPRCASGYQRIEEKVYRNSIEKLLDQEWDSEFIPKTAVEYDYKHFYNSESVLRFSFPEAYIFNMASSTLSKPEDVPPEFRERTLFNFLLSIDMKKYGVKPNDAWRDFGRCILAEKQLDLARRAVVT